MLATCRNFDWFVAHGQSTMVATCASRNLIRPRARASNSIRFHWDGHYRIDRFWPKSIHILWKYRLQFCSSLSSFRKTQRKCFDRQIRPTSVPVAQGENLHVWIRSRLVSISDEASVVTTPDRRVSQPINWFTEIFLRQDLPRVTLMPPTSFLQSYLWLLFFDFNVGPRCR